MLHVPGATPYKVVNKQDLFNKILQSTDFKPAVNSLHAVKIMFNAVFPTIERVVNDNESLLIEQAKVLKTHAELDEKFKKLEQEHEEIRKRLQTYLDAETEVI